MNVLTNIETSHPPPSQPHRSIACDLVMGGGHGSLLCMTVEVAVGPEMTKNTT